MSDYWRPRVGTAAEGWVGFVDDESGYSAFVNAATGLVHLFNDNGGTPTEPADDYGYLCIPNLACLIESLEALKSQIEKSCHNRRGQDQPHDT
jgi:hypothetical protein